MKKYWCYFIFIIWLAYLLISSVLMFTQGFLLTRIVQKDISKCLKPPEKYQGTNDYCEKEQCKDNNSTLDELSNYCFKQKTKVIMVIVDALRYDFALYDENLESPMPYQNKLPILNDMIKAYPNNSRLYKLKVDPPTTTMQRLKAIVTGSLPTFIEIGSNFASSEIQEDNIIKQVTEMNKNVIFMGDDTWMDLQPNKFYRSFPYPSLNVWDLDTVDEGVNSNILSEMRKKDWNMLIAHYLGVDHCGHRYGALHSEMSRKLMEINQSIKKIIRNLDENTILFVLGDHGMTDYGDHGGESERETSAALFVFSQKPLISSEIANNINYIKQIDIVPTISTILGVPIPFSNLGTLIFDALPAASDNSNDTCPEDSSQTSLVLDDLKYILISLTANLKQIKMYFATYTRQTNLVKNDQLINKFDVKYDYLIKKSEEIYSRIFLQQIDDIAKFLPKIKIEINKLFNEMRAHIGEIRQIFEDEWIQFDSYLMSRGLLLMFLTIFFIYMIIDKMPNDILKRVICDSSYLLYTFLIILLSSIVITLFHYFTLIDNLLLTIYFSSGTASIIMLVLLIIQEWKYITLNWYETNKNNQQFYLDMFTKIIVLLNVFCLFSNSYILEENQLSTYLFLSLIWSIVLFSGDSNDKSNKKQTNMKMKFKNTININKKRNSRISIDKYYLVLLAIIISVLTRFSHLFWRCREEQLPWCINSMTALSINKLTTFKLQTLFAVFSLSLYVTITRMWLRTCGCLNGYSINTLIVKYMPTVIVVFLCGYWTLIDLPIETKSKIIVATWKIDIFVWSIYSIVALALIILFISPLYIYVQSTLPPTNNEIKNLIPHLFNKVKNLYNNNKIDEPTIIYGLDTAYSAAFIILTVFILLFYSLLLQSTMANASVLMYTIGVLTLPILSSNKLIKTNGASSSMFNHFLVHNSSIVCWMFLCNCTFYATGHQPTFTNINWNAAFIGTDGKFVNQYLSGFLILINTYGSHILFGLTTPMLIIAPYTLNVMFPNLLTKTEDEVGGEFTLFEQKDNMMHAVFVTNCKYVLFHSIRVFICMFSATIHCRHLMVWGIFTPKLVFESVGLFVTLLSVFFNYIFMIKINSSINKVVNSITS